MFKALFRPAPFVARFVSARTFTSTGAALAPKRIFVANIPWKVSHEELGFIAEQSGGRVTDSHIVKDRDTGRSRGFGFIEVDETDLEKVIKHLDGLEVEGRALKANEALPRPERSTQFSRNQ
ncbi:uncharacterized protein BJ171DRAFT_484745 [Polychytrium aggregatum]|uniref:uncharacterized protein n=1 Tax=Polychytrium aggregatum TaxID=110093 RepID=UPI0022FE86EB|nr:uncharacterized protein BJ171DRAFT_484745 [Polychytrium aggregatum]KAI9209683.1 hypothetical protein BJ171DRAFT_484745 [Polychytrium aggregatum]